MPTTRDIQARLAALGMDPGPIDNMDGPKTRHAAATFKRIRGHAIEDDFHYSGLHRIIWHWPVSGEGVSSGDRDHYHFVVGHDLRVVDGRLPPEANADTRTAYVAHTRALNTGSIGVAIDGMAGATYSPFSPGTAPFTMDMVRVMAELTARLCIAYNIPVSKWTTLSHAEVQPTLNVPQNGKWDIAWLPDMDGPGDPVEVGERIRQMVRAAA